jgi:hypothetical protein
MVKDALGVGLESQGKLAKDPGIEPSLALRNGQSWFRS